MESGSSVIMCLVYCRLPDFSGVGVLGAGGPGNPGNCSIM